MKRDKTEELLLRARACDGDAFVELMELHKQSMYKVAKAYLKREEDVADAISETILDCFEHLEDLRETRIRWKCSPGVREPMSGPEPFWIIWSPWRTRIGF